MISTKYLFMVPHMSLIFKQCLISSVFGRLSPVVSQSISSRAKYVCNIFIVFKIRKVIVSIVSYDFVDSRIHIIM